MPLTKTQQELVSKIRSKYSDWDAANDSDEELYQHILDTYPEKNIPP